MDRSHRTVETEESSLKGDWDALAREASRRETVPKLDLPDMPEREPRLKRKFSEWTISGRLTCFALLASASIVVQFAGGPVGIPSGYYPLPLTLAVIYAALLTPFVWALAWPMVGYRRGTGSFIVLGLAGFWGGIVGYLATLTTEMMAGTPPPPLSRYRAPLLERLLPEAFRLEEMWQYYATWPRLGLMLTFTIVLALWAARAERAAPWLDPAPAGLRLKAAGWLLIALAPMLLFGSVWYMASPTREVRAWLQEVHRFDDEFTSRVGSSSATPLTMADLQGLRDLHSRSSGATYGEYEAELLRLSSEEFQTNSEFLANWRAGYLRQAAASPDATRRPETVARLLSIKPEFGLQVGSYAEPLLLSLSEDPLSALERLQVEKLLKEAREEYIPARESADRIAYRFFRQDEVPGRRGFELFGLPFGRPLSDPLRKAGILPSLERYVNHRDTIGRHIEHYDPKLLTILRDRDAPVNPMLNSIFQGPFLGRRVLEYGEVILAARTFHRDNGAWPSSLEQMEEALSFTAPADRFIFLPEGERLILHDAEHSPAFEDSRGVRLTP